MGPGPRGTLRGTCEQRAVARAALDVLAPSGHITRNARRPRDRDRDANLIDKADS